jgi:hypothetical protein
MPLILIAAVSAWVAVVALVWRICRMAARADADPRTVSGRRHSAA